jgi:hypothetical protein
MVCYLGDQDDRDDDDHNGDHSSDDDDSSRQTRILYEVLVLKVKPVYG